MYSSFEWDPTMLRRKDLGSPGSCRPGTMWRVATSHCREEEGRARGGGEGRIDAAELTITNRTNEMHIGSAQPLIWVTR